jgi:uncharacterized membrane-anchored protein
MKKTLLFSLFIALSITALASKGRDKNNDPKKDSVAEQLREILFIDSVDKALNYKTGKVSLTQQNVLLDIPSGFKFLNAEQTKLVFNKVYGNPYDPTILGSIWPEKSKIYDGDSYVFTIEYHDDGYIKDDDAKEIDYNDLLKTMKESQIETNKERVASGYEQVQIIGWAKSPFYDEKTKILHWAKEAKFGDNTSNVLNYEVRILGRKGYLSMTAVANMKELPLVNADIDKVLGMASFTEGNRYSDFNSSSDRIAEYTIGGLIAGKILAKVGFFALIAKFFKFIVVGVIAIVVGVFKKITGRDTVKDDE